MFPGLRDIELNPQEFWLHELIALLHENWQKYDYYGVVNRKKKMNGNRNAVKTKTPVETRQADSGVPAATPTLIDNVGK